jgi:pimeloyl-ACP methyl ester carboxylesterase
VDGLHVAVAGADRTGPVHLLLHGITASSISFGAAFDALPGPVVVPDLLGFGGSRDRPPATGRFDRASHLAALQPVLPAVGLAGRPVVVVGHSMGAVLALHLAAELPDVCGVIAVSAPLYDDEGQGLSHIGEADLLARLLAAGDLSRRICRWMCEHRDLAQVLWPLLAPRWPWPIAAAGVQHTWPAYRQSLQELVLDSRWRAALHAVLGRGVPVALVDGAADGVPVPGRAAELAAGTPNVTAERWPGFGHDLPVVAGRQVAARVAALSTVWTAGRRPTA